MTDERTPRTTSPMTTRERAALVVAIAAVTMAVGLTLASLTGRNAPAEAGPAPESAAVASDTAAAAEATTTQRVVLVPIAPLEPTGATADGRGFEPAGEARRDDEEAEHEDRDVRREHRRHDDDDDDDDDDGWIAFARGGGSHD